jgi:predicted Zn-dependent protease
MAVRIALGSVLLLAAGFGCLSGDKHLTAVPNSPFKKTGQTRVASFKQAKPATEEESKRVQGVGQKLVAANPRITQKIAFLTVGQTQEEIFHQSEKDVSTIVLTEGLAKQCKTDGELAAVLSQELGKVVSEQMAKMKPARRPLPPMLLADTRIGNNAENGAFGSSDRTEQMMAGHFAQESRQTPSLPATPPPPDTLARLYLKGAGFDAKNLETVAPLLRKAQKQSSVELSMTGKTNG